MRLKYICFVFILAFLFVLMACSPQTVGRDQKEDTLSMGDKSVEAILEATPTWNDFQSSKRISLSIDDETWKTVYGQVVKLSKYSDAELLEGSRKYCGKRKISHKDLFFEGNKFDPDAVMVFVIINRLLFEVPELDEPGSARFLWEPRSPEGVNRLWPLGVKDGKILLVGEQFTRTGVHRYDPIAEMQYYMKHFPRRKL